MTESKYGAEQKSKEADSNRRLNLYPNDVKLSRHQKRLLKKMSKSKRFS